MKLVEQVAARYRFDLAAHSLDANIAWQGSLVLGHIYFARLDHSSAGHGSAGLEIDCCRSPADASSPHAADSAREQLRVFLLPVFETTST